MWLVCTTTTESMQTVGEYDVEVTYTNMGRFDYA